MSRNQSMVVVLAALFAGFLGGVLSQQVGLSVFAQAGPAESIEAQEFRLVDAHGKLLGLIKPSPMALTERSESGSVYVVPFAGGRGAGGGAMMLFDTLGRATWAAPEPIEPEARVRPLTEAN